MKKLFHPFWFVFTLVLSLVFLILFPFAIINHQGLTKTLIFTFLGLAVIWIVYIVRARIFSKF